MQGKWGQFKLFWSWFKHEASLQQHTQSVGLPISAADEAQAAGERHGRQQQQRRKHSRSTSEPEFSPLGERQLAVCERGEPSGWMA